jgi:hypothetical protein
MGGLGARTDECIRMIIDHVSGHHNMLFSETGQCAFLSEQGAKLNRTPKADLTLG